MTSCQRHSFSPHINTCSTAACIVQMKYCHTDSCLMSGWESDVECSVHRHGGSWWTGCLSACVTVSNITGCQIRYMLLIQPGVCGTPYVRQHPLEQFTVIKNVSNTNCRSSLSLHRALRRVTQSAYQLMHTLSFILKLFLKLSSECSDMFRSFDHHQGAVCSLLKLH